MMNKIKALIIDDEKLAREIVKKYLEDIEEIIIVGECSNGFEAIKIINEEKPDVVFLDIQMPKITGFEMLELIEKPPVIIFTTAYDQFALKAFEVNAADYLLKPFSKERFNESIEKALSHIKNKSPQHDVIQNLIKENDRKPDFLERIIIKDGSKITIMPLENIKYIEAQDDYVMIYSTDGKYLKQKTMKYFEDHLDPHNFIRIHRSFIVPVKRIKRIELAEKNSYQVKLDDATILPVSKSGYDNLKDVLG
ncbi:MAG TPA: response regulator [Ignavibacteriaceae bacterium]|nr:response regulator [Ignavibacteriaceae bacterium]